MLFAYKPIPGGEKNSAAGIEEKDAGGDLLWSVYSNLSGGSFAPQGRPVTNTQSAGKMIGGRVFII